MRVNKNSIAEIILKIIANSADGYVRLEDFMYNPSLYAYYGGRISPPKSHIAATIRRLLVKDLIEKSIHQDIQTLKLSQAAQELDNLKTNETQFTDRWVIVVFDIPEQKRLIRNLLRRNLKKWGFKKLQRSVWISRKIVFDKLVRYISDSGIEDWVSVFETNRDKLTYKT